MENEKTILGFSFSINMARQILKRFARTKSWSKTSFFWRVTFPFLVLIGFDILVCLLPRPCKIFLNAYLLHMYVNLIRSLNLEICLKLQPCSWPPDVWTLIIESLAKMSRGQLTIWMLIKFKCHHLLLWGLHNTLKFDEKSGV